MKCPRTGTELKTLNVGGVQIELSEACGGIWFDNYELKKFDEAHESAGEELIRLMEEHQSDDIDLSRRIHCPHHTDVVMMRRFFSPKREIEIDECPMCGGIWLDAGELKKIRQLFPKESDRQRAGEQLAEQAASSTDMQQQLESSASREGRARRFSHFLGWLCPSKYIPGKQDGAAF